MLAIYKTTLMYVTTNIRCIQTNQITENYSFAGQEGQLISKFSVEFCHFSCKRSLETQYTQSLSQIRTTHSS